METRHSLYFTGVTGEAIRPEAFPAGNHEIDDSKYDYEGNWVFCRFESEEVPGARFGFGRGMLDLRDYGSTLEPSRSFLMLHIEVMTKDGAVLWLGTGRFSAEQVDISGNAMNLVTDHRDIFRISGWPELKWFMQSDDGRVEVDMTLKLRNISILPDLILPNNTFAMWVSVCNVNGTVRYEEERIPVSGVAFYDHPRICVTKNAAQAVGWFMYIPVYFADGSSLIACHTEDTEGNPIEHYSFGIYTDSKGGSTWFPECRLRSLQFDQDDKPKSWEAVFSSPGMDFRLEALVEGTSIVKAWGGDSIPQTRKDNGNIPLVFSARAEITGSETVSRLEGKGLAEYISR